MSKAETDKESKLHVLRQQFIKSLPGRLADIDSEWKVLYEEVETDKGVFQDLLRHVHSLAGTSATFGFVALGNWAQKLESILRQSEGHPDLPAFKDQVEHAITKLTEVATEHPDDVSEPAVLRAKESQCHLIYILDEDNSLIQETAGQLRQLDHRVDVFHNMSDLNNAIDYCMPDFFLVDLRFSEQVREIFCAANETRTNSKDRFSIVFMCEYGRWQDRLKAARAGGQAYIAKPVIVDELLEKMDYLHDKAVRESYRVLIVDDDPLLAEHYAAVLLAEGMKAKTLNMPSLLLDTLSEFAPDLILMDLYMPGCNGVEAASVIRQHLIYTHLPIVYLSTETGLQQQLEALRMGGDDFLQKPIRDSHLAAAVRMRAQRFRQLGTLMDKDGLTGLLNHINLKLTLEREIIRAKRQGGSLSFAMLDIDNFKLVNDQYGHPVGDRVIKGLARLLKKRLRKTDVAARYGGEEFAIIFPDTSIQDAEDLLNELRQSFSGIVFTHAGVKFSATFSAGIESYSPPTDMSALIAAADTTLYLAKQRGRNCVTATKNS